MLSFKFLRLLLSNFVIFARGLEVNFTAIDIISTNIVSTENVVKNITNEIFMVLNVKGIKNNIQLKQYASTFNFFSTITAKGDENLRQIAKTARSGSTNSSITSIVDAINDVLNEEPRNKTEDHGFETQVDIFLKNLEQLKSADEYTAHSNIDNQILQLMKEEDTENITQSDIPDDDDDSGYASDIEYWKSSDDAETRRIYKGSNTKVKYFPFMASVHIFQTFQCAGSIVKSDLVITAASCLQLAYNNRFFRENPAFLSVRIGSNYQIGGGESIEVLEVYFYPTYDPKTLRNNLALMRLHRRIKFARKSKRVKKIEFDTNAHPLPVTVHEGITIVGWGAKGASNVVRDPWMNKLSFSVLDVYPLRECQEVYSKQYVTKKEFCGGYFSKGSGACSGDVGGPGIVSGVLVGIISFGSPRCGAPDAPTVFTKIGYYADWIQQVMDQEVPSHRYRTSTRPPASRLTVAPDRKLTTFIIKPYYSNEDDAIPEEDAEDALRTNKHMEDEEISNEQVALAQDTHQEALRNDGNDNLFKEFLSIMFGPHEVKNYEKNLANTMSLSNKQKKLHQYISKTTTPTPEESEEEHHSAENMLIDNGNDFSAIEENDDDEDDKYETKPLDNLTSKATYKPSTTKKFKDNSKKAFKPIKNKNHMKKNTANKNNKNKEVGSNTEVSTNTEEDILQLIENLDSTPDEELDKIIAQISQEPEDVSLNDKIDESNAEEFRNDIQVAPINIVQEKNALKNEQKVNSDQDEDYAHNYDTEFVDLTLRDNEKVKETNKRSEAENFFDILPTEDMFELLAEVIKELTMTNANNTL